MPSSRYYRFKTLNRKDKIKKIKNFIFWAFIIIVFLILAWFIFLSPIFNIRHINISDSSYLNSNEVEKSIIKLAPFGLGKNLMILSKNKLKEELAAAFPALTDIVIKKTLLHTLTINFQKRMQLGIWCGQKDDQFKIGSCYYFDKEGIAFAEAPQTEGSLILKIEDISKNGMSSGNNILNSNQINFIINFYNKINESGKLRILKFRIKPNPSIDLEAITDKDWLIYLDDKQNPTLIADNFLMILKEAVGNPDNLEYVDLRIPGRIFYKLK